MAAINLLTFPGVFTLPHTGCTSVCGHAETHVPVMRVPVVSARWTVEINRDGTRRLVEHWSANQPTK